MVKYVPKSRDEELAEVLESVETAKRIYAEMEQESERQWMLDQSRLNQERTLKAIYGEN